MCREPANDECRCEDDDDRSNHPQPVDLYRASHQTLVGDRGRKGQPFHERDATPGDMGAELPICPGSTLHAERRAQGVAARWLALDYRNNPAALAGSPE